MNFRATQTAFDCGATCMTATEIGRVLNMVKDEMDRNLHARHTKYDTLDKIDLRSMREATTIGAISDLRIVNAEE